MDQRVRRWRLRRKFVRSALCFQKCLPSTNVIASGSLARACTSDARGGWCCRGAPSSWPRRSLSDLDLSLCLGYSSSAEVLDDFTAELMAVRGLPLFSFKRAALPCISVAGCLPCYLSFSPASEFGQWALTSGSLGEAVGEVAHFRSPGRPLFVTPFPACARRFCIDSGRYLSRLNTWISALRDSALPCCRSRVLRAARSGVL